MSDVSGATAPPGFFRMFGDTVGLPGLIASGATIGSKIPGLLAKYGASAGGSLAAAPLTGALTAAQVMQPTPANAGEVPQYIKDATGTWVRNPAAQSQSLLAQAGTPAPTPGSSPAGQPPMPTALPPSTTSPLSDAMAAQASAGVPLPTPRPTMTPSTPGMAPPMSLAPPAPGPTAPPPNLYNGPGSQNFGMGNGVGTATPSSGGVSNAANIMPFLQKLMGGAGGSSMFPQQSPSAQQSNPMGNILPFITNLLGGGGGVDASGDAAKSAFLGF